LQALPPAIFQDELRKTAYQLWILTRRFSLNLDFQ